MCASSLGSDEKPDGGSKVDESQRDTFLAERRVAASRLLREFPDYVPTMLWLGGRMRAEGRLLVARALCVGHVTLLLRPLLRLGPLAAAPLFLWARGRPLPPLASFRFLYEQYAERDGFLHLLMSDLGDPLVEQRAPPSQSTEVASPTLTIAAAAASAAAATATARPPVVFWPPELARSYRGHLRYPSPPEPDEQVLSHAHTDLQRERSDMSEVSMASGLSANSGVASALLLKHTVVPLLTAPTARPRSPRLRRTRRGRPRPIPPRDLPPRAPPPPAAPAPAPATAPAPCPGPGPGSGPAPVAGGPAAPATPAPAPTSAPAPAPAAVAAPAPPGQPPSAVKWSLITDELAGSRGAGSAFSDDEEAWPAVAAAAAGLEEEARVALGLPEGGAAVSAGAVLGAGQESSTWQLFQRASSIAADGHHWRYDDDTTPRVIQNYIPTEESYVHAEMKTATRVPSWLRGFYKDTVPI